MIVGRCGGSLVAHQTFWGRCPGFEYGISHSDQDVLQDHFATCNVWISERETSPEAKKKKKKTIHSLDTAR